MDHTCKLRLKCLKADESLEKCEVAECKYMIHPSCCKKLMATFGEDEWEGPLFCGKHCFKQMADDEQYKIMQLSIEERNI